MTAYNREKYIAEAIESVLTSTYTHFELIIVDDNSIDDTVKIAKEFEAKDTRIKVFVNEKNLGQFPNRNKAASYAKGEYMMYVDSDDKIFPDGFSRLIEIMNSNLESSFGMFSPEMGRVEVVKSKDAIQNHFFKIPFLNHGPGATILRKSFFDKIGKYPVDYGIPGDMFFNLKACCYSSIVLIPFEFMHYRRHENQEINNSYDYLYNNYKYMRDALSLLPLPLTKKQIGWLQKKSKRRFTVNILKYYFKTFHFHKSINAIKQAKFTFRDACEGIFHL
jgi:glycosyltransferase involved in cell wall biosynthesis